MPDEMPFIILLVGFMVVLIVFAVRGNVNDEPRPIKPATEGTIAPAEEC